MKTNQRITELIINSGEAVEPASSVNLLMPKSRKRGDKFINWAIHPVTGLESISIDKVEMGYSMINNVDWGYLK
ncbi:MAG: hypothetical protein HND52_18795 [Ignavibacteriae bacterium]|nr:hypothetical protein [Ignavibacteriota bacterium]NOH00014.1 hypothetical protein [Ignavibacteriota bacterium]